MEAEDSFQAEFQVCQALVLDQLLVEEEHQEDLNWEDYLQEECVSLKNLTKSNNIFFSLHMINFFFCNCDFLAALRSSKGADTGSSAPAPKARVAPPAPAARAAPPPATPAAKFNPPVPTPAAKFTPPTPAARPSPPVPAARAPAPAPASSVPAPAPGGRGRGQGTGAAPPRPSAPPPIPGGAPPRPGGPPPR